MTIQPVLTCAFGIALAAFFELVHNYVDKHWSTPASKECWAGAFWLLVMTVLVQSKLMPTNPPGISPWVPFIVVSVIHILLVLDGDGFSRLPWTPPPNLPDGGASSPSNNANGQNDRNIQQNVSKPKPTNNQNG